MRKFILGAMVASAIVATGAAKTVRADTDVYLNFGPPAVRYEAAPAPRAGYVWAPGFCSQPLGLRSRQSESPLSIAVR